MLLQMRFTNSLRPEMTQNKPKSYLGKIPSRDFWDEAYELYLTIATPEELEEDIISRKTLQKLTTELGLD